MTGRERVKACLAFAGPDRAPRDLWTLPYVDLFQKDDLDAVVRECPPDIGTAWLKPDWLADVSRRLGRAGVYTDDWGSVWHVGEPGILGEVKRPALTDWADLEGYRPPWHLIRERDLSHADAACEASGLFMLSEVTARPFERMQFLRGTEDLFIDIACGTRELRRLLEMVHEFYLEDIRGWCRSNVDGVFFMDDWGSARALLIDPAAWRELFKPLYRDYCDVIHAAGKSAFFHSDGNIQAIYGDLVEMGVDAVNSQLFAMDIEGLAREYKGRIAFWGEIDRQHVLPFGTQEEVRDAVVRVRRALDDGSGGVIAQCEWGKGNPAANVRAVFNAWGEPLGAEAE
ncbi:MAG: uroporphyrinogen decarboxylase family protein [Planctomycetota bacterium]